MCRHGGGTAPRRAAWYALEVPRILARSEEAGFCRGAHRKFVHVRFANYDSTFFAQFLDNERVVWGNIMFQHLRGARGSQPFGRNGVFNCDGDAGQPPIKFARISFFSLLSRTFVVDSDKCVEFASSDGVK